MKIGLVFTGGTIGSSVNNDGYISTDEKATEALLDYYASRHVDIPEFAIFNPFCMLSENLNAEYSNALVAAVDEALAANTDGVIVTHGTDTLQFSAAHLSYALGAESKPVVLVSSNYPLGDPRANGLTNFEAAVDFIISGKGRGVFVSYNNDADKVFIHRGSRLLAHATFSDALCSAGNAYYGVYDKGIYTINPLYTAKTSANTLRAPLSSAVTVLWLTAHPDMSYPEIDESTRAVLLSTYHSGTVCTDERFKDFCENMHSRNVLVYLAGVSFGTPYESTKAFVRLGVVLLEGLSPIAAYVKLRLIFAGDGNTAQMKENIGEDLLPQ